MFHSPWERNDEGMQGEYTELLADKEDAISSHLLKMFGVFCYVIQQKLPT
jgi:hypothetical protein